VDDRRFVTWLGDAEATETRERVSTARAVHAFALRVFLDCRDLWRLVTNPRENKHGTYQSFDKLVALPS
jgi:pre-mRNA-processing factor 6